MTVKQKVCEMYPALPLLQDLWTCVGNTHFGSFSLPPFYSPPSLHHFLLHDFSAYHSLTSLIQQFSNEKKKMVEMLGSGKIKGGRFFSEAWGKERDTL